MAHSRSVEAIGPQRQVIDEQPLGDPPGYDGQPSQPPQQRCQAKRGGSPFSHVVRSSGSYLTCRLAASPLVFAKKNAGCGSNPKQQGEACLPWFGLTTRIRVMNEQDGRGTTDLAATPRTPI